METGEQSDDGSEDDDGEEPKSNEKMAVMVMMKMETRRHWELQSVSIVCRHLLGYRAESKLQRSILKPLLNQQ